MHNRTRYQWKRFWCPPDGKYSLADRGFLVDPGGEFGRALQPDLVAFDAIADAPCLVLLGEPGIGKTFALADVVKEREAVLAASGGRVHQDDLGQYNTDTGIRDEIFGCDAFTDWAESDYVLELFLDGLDECIVEMRSVAKLLVRQLRKCDLTRLRLRLVCRTAVWPGFLEQDLRELWDDADVRLYELVPLCRKDMLIAAEQRGVDASGFGAEVIDKDAVPFAIKPITLEMLLDAYRETGAIPSTQAELYRQGCLRLCAARGHRRQEEGDLTYEQRLAVAERIAALTLFGRRTAICRDVGDSVALYEEFLAAEYLIHHELAPEQIADLVFRPAAPGEAPHVVPQLRETAVWLAVAVPEIMERIAAIDPRLLLRRQVAELAMSVRARLTEVLLQLEESGRAEIHDFGLSDRYEVLAHPGLEDKLPPYIEDTEKRRETRALAIDIARSCRVEGLVPALLAIALSDGEQLRVRECAARAVAEIGDAEAKRQLRPLLSAGEADENDQLKAYALRALWPAELSAEELFAALTPPKRQMYLGAYQYVISNDLLPHIALGDLPVALKWAGRQGRDDSLSIDIRDLVQAILCRGWEHFDTPEVREPFAEAATERVANHDGILGNQKNRIDLSREGPDKRRQLVKLLIPKLAAAEARTWLLLSVCPRILSSEDVPWLLEQLTAAETPDEEKAWVHLIWRLCDRQNTQQVMEVFEASKANTALHERFSAELDPVPLDSPQARRLREYFREEAELEQEHEKAAPTHPPHPDMAERWLVSCPASSLTNHFVAISGVGAPRRLLQQGNRNLHLSQLFPGHDTRSLRLRRLGRVAAHDPRHDSPSRQRPLPARRGRAAGRDCLARMGSDRRRA